MSRSVRLDAETVAHLMAEGRIPVDVAPTAVAHRVADVTTANVSTHSLSSVLKPRRRPRPPVDWPAVLARQCVAARLPAPLAEWPFAAPDRRWRFDLAWPDRRIAVEVDGGGWVEGRHGRGQGIEGDCEKYSEAAARGWRLLRVTPRQVRLGQALGWVERALAWRPG